MKAGASFTSVTFTVIAWVVELVPSLAVTVAVYDFLVSKSGADIKVKTPEVVIANSDPDTTNVTAPAGSLAVTGPIEVWF
ncbi:hypothetical protein N8880_04705, partial [Gammaproteobacteria bacterium]|nr:hypothetical protein [Gammaproteobacteria bacterium]